MISAGDIYLADLNEEVRRHVLVVSVDRFNRLSDRVIVVPELGPATDEIQFPWRVDIDGAVYAVDFVRSMPASRLLERTSRAPASQMLMVRRALRQLT